jgi:hypothetical protein
LIVSMAYLEIPGVAADHLYREGSANASFWEAVFGSSLRAKRRTQVSTLADGTRRFDVPLLTVEGDILRNAQAWITSPERGDSGREAAAAMAAGSVRVRLIGLQPQGQAVATFALRFEPAAVAHPTTAAIAAAFRAWFAAEGPRVARETLVPFGFTPHPS